MVMRYVIRSTISVSIVGTSFVLDSTPLVRFTGVLQLSDKFL